MSEQWPSWYIGDDEYVWVGDEVIGHESHRGRITGVDPDNGNPRISYDSGPLAGETYSLHPFRIRKAD